MPKVLGIKIEIREDLVTVRTHGRIMKQINQEMGEWHKKKTILKHFENVPETRPGGAYGYKAREQRYAFRKQKMVGHRIPNVLTGKMRSVVLSSSIITATQYRWTFTAKNYFPMRVEQRDELEAISPGEVTELSRRMASRYVYLAQRPENRRKRRRKAKR